MHLIVGGRQSGKTFEVMRRLASERDAVLVVHSAAERGRLLKDYKWPGIENQIISFDSDTRHYLRGLNIPALYVDNLDLIMGPMFGRIPTAVTFTGTAELLGRGVVL